MDPIGKALWFIETNLGGELSLADIATFVGVSRYHLLRAFGAATGQSVMSYVRRRRLTEAAKQLTAGAADILAVALDADYASHEAFTRAFRDQFGITPETARARGHVDNIKLMEAIAMDDNLVVELPPPRFETGRAMLIAGLGERYTFETNQGIPFQWQRFVPYISHIPGQIGRATYGLCCNQDGAGSFDYVCGVEVGSFADLPSELQRVRVPRQPYAVFTHDGHVSRLRAVAYTIWNKFLPGSGLEVADSPDFELYGEHHDGKTGMGITEVWVPIKNDAAK
jgi:AraC family transcriptional regulator